jgi:hypothetical protein
VGIDPYEKIDPAVIPTDSRISGLISRHNRAVSAAKRMENTFGNQDDLDREWEIAAETVGELDNMGYDPDDYSWGR